MAPRNDIPSEFFNTLLELERRTFNVVSVRDGHGGGLDVAAADKAIEYNGSAVTVRPQ